MNELDSFFYSCVDACVHATIIVHLPSPRVVKSTKQLPATSRGALKFGFGRDVPQGNLKVDPYKYQFFKKK